MALYKVLEVIKRKSNIVLDDKLAPSFDYQAAGNIHFDNVYFKYPSRDDPALKGVTFAIETGKMTAIVGPSGSGKSTTVKLLERYYDPMNGKIVI